MTSLGFRGDRSLKPPKIDRQLHYLRTSMEIDSDEKVLLLYRNMKLKKNFVQGFAFKKGLKRVTERVSITH